MWHATYRRCDGTWAEPRVYLQHKDAVKDMKALAQGMQYTITPSKSETEKKMSSPTPTE